MSSTIDEAMMEDNTYVNENMWIKAYDLASNTQGVNSHSKEEKNILIDTSENVIKSEFEASYKNFLDWQHNRNISSFSENTLMDYFKEIAEKQSSPLSLYRNYYLLKNALLRMHNFDLRNYPELRAFLKSQLERSQEKSFSAEEINRFIFQAPNEECLATKVAIILGIVGECCTDELKSISLSDIQDLGSSVQVTVHKEQTNSVRTFKISDTFYQIFKKYADIRSSIIQCSSFLLWSKNSSCIPKNIESNDFGEMWKQVAEFLKLPNSESYADHNISTLVSGLVVVDGKVDNTLHSPVIDLNKVDEEEYSSSDSDTNFSSDSDVEEVLMYDPLNHSSDIKTDKENEANFVCQQNISTIVVKEEINTADYSNQDGREPNQVASIESQAEQPHHTYETPYENFMDWRRINNINSLTEDVILLYFQELSRRCEPSTLWKEFFILKSKLIENNELDIGKYSKLMVYLKEKDERSKMFTWDEVNKFVLEAQDDIYLSTKVATVMGIVGDCTVEELQSLTIHDVQDLGSAMLVSIHKDTVTVNRKFMITDRFYEICKKYAKIRSPVAESSHFFLVYTDGSCTPQHMNTPMFNVIGKQIATFLSLPNPEMYTEGSFPRLSTLVINNCHTVSECNQQQPAAEMSENTSSNKEDMVDNTQSSNEDVDGDTRFTVTIKEENSEDSIYEKKFMSQYNFGDVPALSFKEEMLDSDADNITTEDEPTNSSRLPEKSRALYESVYTSFMDWRKSNNINTFDEDVIVEFFKELLKKYTPSSILTRYSMLRSTLEINHNIFLKQYSKLRSFLKEINSGYKKKSYKTFTSEEINKFISEAPDEVYLPAKVALIIGVTGACDAHEMRSLNIEDIQDFGSAMLVTIRKSRGSRSFTISDDYYHVCKRYINMRPQNINNSSLFLHYNKDKCTAHNIGINKFGVMVRQVAEFLKLPNTEVYTTRIFRKLSTKLYS